MTPPLSYEDLTPGKTYLAELLEGPRQTMIVRMHPDYPEGALVTQQNPTVILEPSDFAMWDFYEISLPAPQRIKGSDLIAEGYYFLRAPGTVEKVSDDEPSSMCWFIGGRVLLFTEFNGHPVSRYADYWFVPVPWAAGKSWTTP